MTDDKKTKQQPKAYDPEEKVEYTAPFGADLKDDSILCAVNGEEIRIKRGETVKIKRKFVEVLRNAAEQERASMRFQQEAQKSSAKALAEM